MTKVKLCGITTVDDARLAAELGAWAVGVIFHPDSPRACDPDVAAAIGAALHRQVEVAGVFANAHLDDVAGLADACSLTLVQLHGDEGPAYCSEVERRTGCRVIKAARAKDASAVQALRAFRVAYHLLDAASPDRLGGTGQTFAWELAGAHDRSVPLILSGGINATNAAAAIAAVRPFALDSASGTESAPGRKDPEKVRALLDAAAGATSAVA